MLQTHQISKKMGFQLATTAFPDHPLPNFSTGCSFKNLNTAFGTDSLPTYDSFLLVDFPL